MRSTPNRLATRPAADLAQASPLAETSVARRFFPLSQEKPASCQPMVPLRSAMTLFGTPALMSDCAPMRLRVRPAQLTTTVVCGERAMSRTRNTSSAPGTLIAVGIDIRAYSPSGRLSSTTTSAPLRNKCSSLSAAMLGVPAACSTNSPNALLGTLTPENSSKPASAHAPTRHQAGNQQFQAAQRHRARPQQMRSREDPLLAQVEDCQLLPVGEHRLEIARAHHLHHIIAGSGRSFRAHPHVACCAVICVAFPVARSNRRRAMRSRLVPVTRMKRALAG